MVSEVLEAIDGEVGLGHPETNVWSHSESVDGETESPVATWDVEAVFMGSAGGASFFCGLFSSFSSEMRKLASNCTLELMFAEFADKAIGIAIALKTVIDVSPHHGSDF